MNMAVSNPKGTPIIIAPAVTYTDPAIIGRIPKLEGESCGFQLVPIRNSTAPILPMAGQPFINIKKHIKNTAKIDMQADIKNKICINVSAVLPFFLFLCFIGFANTDVKYIVL